MWHKDKESMKLIGGGLLIAALLFGVAYGIAALLDRSVETGEIAGQDMPKFGGAPTVSYQVSLLPASSTPIYDLGTSTRKWNGLYVNTASTTGVTADYICLNGDCQSTWSSGTADGTFSTTSAMYFMQSSTTVPTTFKNNTWTGTQTYSAAPVFSTITSALLATNSGGTVIATTTPTASVFNATDASATSTFAGNAYVKGNLRVDGNFYAPVQIVSSGDATINGALTVTGQTTLATSLTSLLWANSGVVSNSTISYPLTFTAGTLALAPATSTPTFGNAFSYSGTVGYFLAGTSGTLQSVQTPTFSFPPGARMATTTTATTTVALGSAWFAETWNGVECWSGSGTVPYQFSDGTNKMNSLLATTTVSRFSLTTNNTFTAGEKRFVDIGPMTASYISCTVNKTI